MQYAVGYPTEKYAANVKGSLLERKLKTFAVYAAHDPVIKCSDSAGCVKVNRFGDWLQRQYLIPHVELERND